jgi:outer membrane protein OmpA-like peptidoglycan-associated protein
LAAEVSADQLSIMKGRREVFSFSLFVLPLLLAGAQNVSAQLSPLPGVRLGADQAGCTDSKFFPKFLDCRIDNCEKKENDRRDIPVGDDGKGEAISTSMEGISRAVMYECREGTTPTTIIEKAELVLKAGGFEIPYRFLDAEASLTARKDNLWVTVDAASKYYTLIETRAAEPDFESATDAESIGEMMERFGHVALSDIQFVPGRTDLMPSSSTILGEVAALMKDHPAWRLRVEGHTDNTGTKTANLNLSFFRATAVVNWLAANGIKKGRLEPKGLGDTQPIADNTTEAGRSKNHRIELVKIGSPAGQ